MKTILTLLTLFNFGFIMSTTAQTAPLPLKEWQNATKSTYIFYLTGDGGMNKFSTNLCAALNKSGYAVTALNSRSYFWSKKSPAAATKEIGDKIQSALKTGKYKNFSIIGYSFGADVLPFIVHLFPQQLNDRLSGVIFISPSPTTDFQIHVLDMLGKKQKESMDVVAAINQLQIKKSAVLMGEGEADFPVKKITLPNNDTELLPGGHHYDDDIPELVNTIISHL